MRDVFGRTPLQWAAMGGRLDLINSVWPRWSSPESLETRKDKLGCSLIHFFSMGNCLDGVRRLMDSGTDVGALDSHGWTALHWAAYLGHRELVLLLLSYNADRFCANSRGWLPFHLAVFVGADVVARSLETVDNVERIDVQKAKISKGFCNSCLRVGISRAYPLLFC